LCQSAKPIGSIAMLPRLPSVFWRVAQNQRGVTLVEYTLLIALISVMSAAALNILGPRIQGVLTTAASAMN
jgi:Flp pilus assembly pilin Flp